MFSPLPNSTIVMLAQEAQQGGVHDATFGVGTTRKLESVAKISGLHFNLLKRTYGSITKTFNLGNKSDRTQIPD
jgi:hypothetical protein